MQQPPKRRTPNRYYHAAEQVALPLLQGATVPNTLNDLRKKGCPKGRKASMANSLSVGS